MSCMEIIEAHVGQKLHPMTQGHVVVVYSYNISHCLICDKCSGGRLVQFGLAMHTKQESIAVQAQCIQD